jgi:NAD dependent epimerase/dehydratase family enzyme
VMSPDRGGAFDTLCNLVRFGVGGQQASGRQFVSWIHHEDFVSALSWLIAHEEIAGPVNVAAPEPLANAEFMRDLRRAARMPIGLPATSWMLEMGAFVLRTETELILKSRRVVPARLVKSGFEFRFPSWLAAAVELWAERTSTR